ncbi:CsbD family protein [Sphingomonas jatrophae]|uniref:Uncharacterized conserved protein YjbJ, UPF0337 family n=1 Tax=Sphingomonas jatrophae TaxID=1166337 RepID=A0A1I6K906_9SPHN|nr:CsbD family protein [Sphingomonas jatrophae]SFR87743.1 Uncharacterized conserved protein YjbJ, UPF0337 family [Sphingomonas jatrophae]
MGEMTDKIKGVANQVAGEVKKAVGDAQDRPDVVAEGEAQKTEGQAQHLKGSVKGALGDKI